MDSTTVALNSLEVARESGSALAGAEGIIGVIVSVLIFVFLLIASLKDIAKNKKGIPRKKDWENLESKITGLGQDNFGGHDFHPMIKNALGQVLGNEPGSGYPARVPLALQPLEFGVEGIVRVYKEWAGFFVMVALVVTTSFLAFAFYKINPVDGELNPKLFLQHFQYVFFVNAGVLLVAVVYHLFHLEAKTQGDSHLRKAYETLSLVREIRAEEVDPNLAAALDHIAKRFEDWSERAERQSLRRVDDLVAEMRSLSEAVREMFKEALKPEDEGDTEERIELAIRNLGVSLEQLYSRLDETSTLILKTIADGTPATNALREAAEKLVVQSDIMANQDREKLFGEVVAELRVMTGMAPRNNQALLGALAEQRTTTVEGLNNLVQETRQVTAAVHQIESRIASQLLEETKGGEEELLRKELASMREALASSFNNGVVELGGKTQELLDLLALVSVDTQGLVNLAKDEKEEKEAAPSLDKLPDMLGQLDRTVGQLSSNTLALTQAVESIPAVEPQKKRPGKIFGILPFGGR
jgi:hypothetical protein